MSTYIKYKVGYNRRTGLVFIKNIRAGSQYLFTIPEGLQTARALAAAAAAAKEAAPMPEDVYVEVEDDK